MSQPNLQAFAPKGIAKYGQLFKDRIIINPATTTSSTPFKDLKD